MVGRDEDWKHCFPVVLPLPSKLELLAGKLLLEPVTLLKIYNVAHHGLKNQDKAALLFYKSSSKETILVYNRWRNLIVARSELARDLLQEQNSRRY